MKIRISSLAPQRGLSYMTVVITMIVVGLMLAAYLKLVSVQNQMVARSESWNRTVPVLEAGVEEAMAHLNKNGSGMAWVTGAEINLNADGWQGSAATGWTKFGWVGKDYYVVGIGPYYAGASCPEISSTGYVYQTQAFSWNKSFGPFVADAAATLEQLVSQGKYTRRLVQCPTTNIPVFAPPFVTRRGIDMNGQNVTVDSFDSQIPGRNVSNRWHVSIRRDKGDVASNDTITNAVIIGNANVYGMVRTGPYGTASILRNGSVGSKAWVDGGNKGIQPGWFRDDMNMEFPDVVMPNVVWSAMPPGGSVGSQSYNYVFNQPGHYRLPSGTLNGKILIATNNVVIRVDSDVKISSQDGIWINPGSSVRIYLNCPSAQLTGQGIVNTAGTAAQCYIFGTPVLRNLEVGGNGEITAAIYAPRANVALSGSGTGSQDFSGAIIANTFKFNGHYKLHADEALARIGIFKGFAITSWNEK